MKKLLLLLFILPILAFSQQETKRKYYASGKLLSIINYTHAIREGSCEYFYDYEAWAVMAESNYKNGQIEKEGKYQYTESGIYSREAGGWKYYYDNGKSQRESIITDGVGKMKYYDKNGKEIPMSEGGC